MQNINITDVLRRLRPSPVFEAVLVMVICVVAVTVILLRAFA